MPDNPLAKKLLIKPGYRALLLNVPQGYREQLNLLPEGVQVSDEASGSFDLAHLFVTNRAELESRAPSAMKAVKPGGALWVSYPKQNSKVKTDITRDAGWDVFAKVGWRPVSLVSIDDVWSALRFRPLAEVGS